MTFGSTSSFWRLQLFKDLLVFWESSYDLVLRLSVLQQRVVFFFILRWASNVRIKLIDFGSACTESSMLHSYIQSRFYRPMGRWAKQGSMFEGFSSHPWCFFLVDVHPRHHGSCFPYDSYMNHVTSHCFLHYLLPLLGKWCFSEFPLPDWNFPIFDRNWWQTSNSIKPISPCLVLVRRSNFRCLCYFCRFAWHNTGSPKFQRQSWAVGTVGCIGDALWSQKALAIDWRYILHFWAKPNIIVLVRICLYMYISWYTEVSWIRGTPKSSILRGFSTIFDTPDDYGTPRLNFFISMMCPSYPLGQVTRSDFGSSLQQRHWPLEPGEGDI